MAKRIFRGQSAGTVIRRNSQATHYRCVRVCSLNEVRQRLVGRTKTSQTPRSQTVLSIQVGDPFDEINLCSTGTIKFSPGTSPCRCFELRCSECEILHGKQDLWTCHQTDQQRQFAGQHQENCLEQLLRVPSSFPWRDQDHRRGFCPGYLRPFPTAWKEIVCYKKIEDPECVILRTRQICFI